MLIIAKGQVNLVIFVKLTKLNEQKKEITTRRVAILQPESNHLLKRRCYPAKRKPNCPALGEAFGRCQNMAHSLLKNIYIAAMVWHTISNFIQKRC